LSGAIRRPIWTARRIAMISVPRNGSNEGFLPLSRKGNFSKQAAQLVNHGGFTPGSKMSGPAFASMLCFPMVTWPWKNSEKILKICLQ
ncbi:MAG: hypothetical protein OES79_05125, partial [Planctomycetota bacterium]|nr:hypothetical protein [Planctomycetota bacterium]